MPNPFEDISKKNQKKLLWLLESKEEDFTKGTSINSYYKNTSIYLFHHQSITSHNYQQ